ncbi:MAG: nicotinate (nicotinamide) nucleotide adenylyltransferase [Verrucomicrobiota bacterium]
MERIGLFGGSFNPVHGGHLLVAQSALEELELSRLFFIPAAQSPFKPGVQLAPGQERLRLLRLALVGQSRCAIDDQEIERAGISYSIDTVRNYARSFPHAELWYLIGGDHAPLLPKWRESSELAARVQIGIIARPGQSATALPAPFRGRTLRGWPFDISASEIRARVRAGRPIDWLVPSAVAEAIRIYRLYL